MSFQVKLSAADDAGTEYADKDKFEFLDDGVLKVTADSEITYYSPSAWQGVRTSNNHQPTKLVRIRPRDGARATVLG